MLFELFNASFLAASDTVCRVLGQDLLEEVARLDGQSPWDRDFFVEDVVHFVNEALIIA